jgi:hypothetical protein
MTPKRCGRESAWGRVAAPERWPIDNGQTAAGTGFTINTQRKYKIPTTKAAVERAMALGLGGFHLILHKASRYTIDIMNGERAFSGFHEWNDRWSMGICRFLASTLPLTQPSHSPLDEDRRLWLEITQLAFQSGAHREEDRISRRCR